jgi:hypothetical protein
MFSLARINLKANLFVGKSLNLSHPCPFFVQQQRFFADKVQAITLRKGNIILRKGKINSIYI